MCREYSYLGFKATGTSCNRELTGVIEICHITIKKWYVGPDLKIFSTESNLKKGNFGITAPARA